MYRATTRISAIIFYCALTAIVSLAASLPIDSCDISVKSDLHKKLAALYQQEIISNNINNEDTLVLAAGGEYCAKHEDGDTCCEAVAQMFQNTYPCVQALLSSTTQQNDTEQINTCDVEDDDVLDQILKIIAINEDDFDVIVRNSERYLNNSQRLAVYKTLSKMVGKGKYTTVKKLYNRAQSMLENTNSTLSDKKSLYKILYGIAHHSLIQRVEGNHNADFFLDLLRGPYRQLGYFVVRDVYLYLANRTANGEVITTDFLKEMIDLCLVLSDHEEDVKEPITGLLSRILHIIRQSGEYESLEEGVKSRLDAVYGNLNNFEKVLFVSGEFCINMQLFDESKDVYERNSPTVFIRNAGTVQEPNYSWYLWSNNLEGSLFRLMDKKIGVIAANADGYDIESTIYKKLNRYRGGFLKLRKDICVNSFDTFMQYLCLPLDEMMMVFKESEGKQLDYVDKFMGEQSDNCVRMTYKKSTTKDINNNI